VKAEKAALLAREWPAKRVVVVSVAEEFEVKLHAVAVLRIPVGIALPMGSPGGVDLLYLPSEIWVLNAKVVCEPVHSLWIVCCDANATVNADARIERVE